MKTSLVKSILILFTIAFCLMACSKDDLNYDSPNVPRAGFTMINIYPNVPYVIHKADNNYIQSMNAPLSFKNINFVYLFPGNRKIQTLDNTSKLLLDTTFTIQDSLLYTSIIYNKPNNKFGQILSSDQLVNNLGNKAAMRYYNLAENNIITSLFISGTEIFPDRIYDGFNSSENANKSTFISVDNGTQKIEIKNQNDEVIATKDVNFKSTYYYSVILIKHSSSDNYEILVYEQYKN